MVYPRFAASNRAAIFNWDCCVVAAPSCRSRLRIVLSLPRVATAAVPGRETGGTLASACALRRFHFLVLHPVVNHC